MCVCLYLGQWDVFLDQVRCTVLTELCTEFKMYSSGGKHSIRRDGSRSRSNCTQSHVLVQWIKYTHWRSRDLLIICQGLGAMTVQLVWRMGSRSSFLSMSAWHYHIQCIPCWQEAVSCNCTLDYPTRPNTFSPTQIPFPANNKES